MADFTQAIKILEVARDSACEHGSYLLQEKEKINRKGAECADAIAVNDAKIHNYNRSIELLKDAQHGK